MVQSGATVRLRVATEGDLDYIMAVENRPGNVEWILPESREAHGKSLDNVSGGHLIVERVSDGRPVGFFMLASLDSPHREIEWRKVIIDEPGRGYGREAMRLLFAWSFETRRCHRGWLDCKDTNARALRFYEQLGLVREGLLRDTLLTHGRFENLVLFSMLEGEYFARYRGENHER